MKKTMVFGEHVLHHVYVNPCKGCYFFGKRDCPDCGDNMIWVEEGSNIKSPWHTGTPTEEGWYVCKLHDSDLYETQYFTGMNWDEILFEKWQKIRDDTREEKI